MSLVGLIKIYNIEYKLDACTENWQKQQQQCHAWTHIFINNNCWNSIIACNNYAAGHSTARKSTARTILRGYLVQVDQGEINFKMCENCKRRRRGGDEKIANDFCVAVLWSTVSPRSSCVCCRCCCCSCCCHRCHNGKRTNVHIAHCTNGVEIKLY